MSSVGPDVRAGDRWLRRGSFVAWMAIGAGGCLALLTPLTIGPFVLVAVVVALGVLLWRSGGVDAGVTGLLPGVGVLLLYIAYLNRNGPGEVCRTSATEHQCTSEWSPWPWLVAGVLLLAAGVALFRRIGRGGPPTRRNDGSSTRQHTGDCADA